MPRKRKKENKGLPARWRLYHGAYYYQVPRGQENHWDGKRQFRLGGTMGEAAQAWATRMSAFERPATYIRELLDRYAAEIIPTKSPATRTTETIFVVNLRKVFGDMRIGDILPQDIYRYADTRVDKAGKKIHSTARHEIGILKHVYTKAVEWGLLPKHPFKGEVRLQGGKPRSRYIEDWEIEQALALDSTRKKGSIKMIQAYIRIKRLTGMRRGDMLRIRMTDLTDDGIKVTPSKTANTTGIKRIYAWTPELRDAVETAKAARPIHIAPFLFCNGRGEGYIDEETGRPDGWNSMWQRFMKRVLTETDVTERFTEHDIRAKVASDAHSTERAQELMGHSDSKITQRVYRRKPETIKPLR